MTEPERAEPGTEPDVTRQGVLSLGALGIGVLLIVAAGIVGVSMGMHGGDRGMMWGGPDPRVEAAAGSASDAAGAPGAEGFQIDGMPAHMVAHYEHARANANVYAQVPCFCGCQEMLAHRNLEDCFVTPDGAWDSHASGCQVCIDESQMLMRMMGRGMGPGMMRDRIVAEFGSLTMGMGG
jgi:hypothetical protein